jgi:hypothetical protein
MRAAYSTSCASCQRLNHLVQRAAAQPLHREERRSLVGAEVVDQHDRGMFEAALDPRLAQESRDRVAIARLSSSLIARSRSIRTGSANPGPQPDRGSPAQRALAPRCLGSSARCIVGHRGDPATAGLLQGIPS